MKTARKIIENVIIEHELLKYGKSSYHIIDKALKDLREIVPKEKKSDALVLPTYNEGIKYGFNDCREIVLKRLK